MKEYTLGLIGAGNMADAIIRGAITKNVIEPGSVFVYDIDKSKLDRMENELGVRPAISSQTLCEQSDIIIVAVKPNVMKTVLFEIKEQIGAKPIVSIAAGWSAEMIMEIVDSDKKVLRLMPNTPLMVGEGMTVFESPSSLLKDEQDFVEKLFAALGKIEFAPARLMDAATAVAGSGPAYVYMFIEAMADAGVLCGLPRDKALNLAAQTALGAAKMVADTGAHPGELKDAVCSPGGTTIEAVKSLENDGLRKAVINAVEKCAAKSKKMAKS